MNIKEIYPKYALSGRMEIHPCVLQDIGPLGPLPKKGRNKNIVSIAQKITIWEPLWTHLDEPRPMFLAVIFG